MILLLTIAIELLVTIRKSRKDNEFKEVENEDTHLFI